MVKKSVNDCYYVKVGPVQALRPDGVSSTVRFMMDYRPQ